MTNDTTAFLCDAKATIWELSKKLGEHMITEGNENVIPQLEVAIRHLNEAYSQLEKAMLVTSGRPSES